MKKIKFKKYVFIVNGTETKVRATEKSILKDLVEVALKQTSSTRHISEYQIICNDNFLQLEKNVNAQRTTTYKAEEKNEHLSLDDKVIFVSLRAGQGA